MALAVCILDAWLATSVASFLLGIYIRKIFKPADSYRRNHLRNLETSGQLILNVFVQAVQFIGQNIATLFTFKQILHRER